MASLYFYNIDSESCTTLDLIKERIIDDELKEKTVYEAVRMVGSGLFWCKLYQECGEVGEGCGKECEGYKPRNGKNGRCIHSGYCYEFGKEVLIEI